LNEPTSVSIDITSITRLVQASSACGSGTRVVCQRGMSTKLTPQ
jgi:hypothetical protein